MASGVTHNNETCIKSERSYIETELGNYSLLASNDCIHETDERVRYIVTYAILMAAAMYAYIHRTFAFFSMCLKASTTLHDKLFRGISRATMYFYNNNSSGRILNRFSRDINIIDISLPPALIECLSVS